MVQGLGQLLLLLPLLACVLIAMPVLGRLVDRPRVLLALLERGLRLQPHPVRLVTLALGRLRWQPPRQASALIALLALGHQ